MKHPRFLLKLNCKNFVFLTTILLFNVSISAQNLCATVTNPCDLVFNGNFEQNFGMPTAYGQIQNACNWFQPIPSDTPDYFHTEPVMVWSVYPIIIL